MNEVKVDTEKFTSEQIVEKTLAHITKEIEAIEAEIQRLQATRAPLVELRTTIQFWKV